MVKPILRQDLKEVLMEPQSPGLKEPYYLINGENDQRIVIISPGKNGNEFNKTYGYFSNYPAVETYHIVFGQGVLVMQRNDLQGEPKELKVVGIRGGNMIEVPVGYGHCLVNVGKHYLVAISTSAPPDKFQDPTSIKEKHGLAYYLIDKKGDVAFEANPNYLIHPQISTG